ncbi:MAG: ABC transporter substrate-binding protein [Myxococcota bacterium]
MSQRTNEYDAACRAVCVLLALAVASVSVAEQAGVTKQPGEIVDSLHSELLDVMKEAETLGYQGRYSRLVPVLNELFDIPFMAKKSVGRYWKTVDEQGRARLLATFGRFTVANYAGRFSDYSDQYFETLKVVESTHGTFLVHSKLVTPNGETVQLNYRLRPVDDGWRIIDVYLNGTVSELALRRSEYSSLIQREGFDALLTALDERISALESGSSENSS